MRGTLHLVSAEDLPWMLQLTAWRLITRAAARRTALELDLPQFEHARELAVTALTSGHQLRRDELLAVWNEGGLITAGQRGYHMI